MSKTITTEEGNKLIAESPFAADYTKATIVKMDKFEGNHDRIVEFAQYHKNWNLLMPVVEKIGQHEYTDSSWTGCEKYENTPYLRTFGMRNCENGKYLVRFNAMPLFEADTLIEATWLAVVDYIKSK